MSTPTHKPLVDYFKSLNSQHVSFPEKSFFRLDLDEIMGAFRTGINFPCMAVESAEGSAEDSTPNNSVLGRTFAFTIYHKPTKNNYTQQNEYLDICEQYGLQIIARMRFDNGQPSSLIYNKFDVNTVNYIKVGPVFNEELYGYRFTGTIKGSESLKVDPAQWADIDTACPE